MPISKAQQKAVAKYNAANYDRIELRVDKGKKEEYKSHAENRGESLNAFINRAIAEAMARDSENSFILTDPSESSYNAGK